ncbi:hypothetical protein K469DRAFT_704780 [Zopfia rhizophila CBS 207.26]|uniref:Uncharacterized protein n=1 Tax=Zopfia rhizophila CBS 207.26 TaxID=1314779 RepID=A0A6A6E7C0_9PEZI|nr:hypothetical protein K469DRAFT_704780 [Zopfia rhizophila CBS 207.26]
MPALTIPSPTNGGPISHTTSAHAENPNRPDTDTCDDRNRDESDSPDRPPVSPITPVASVAQLAPVERVEPQRRVPPPQATTFMQQPSPVPISENENPDAIALRSAISLLQLQREKSKRDLKTLEELKAAAVSDPQGFVRALETQRARQSKSNSDILTPTLSDVQDTIIDGDGEIQNRQRDGIRQKDSASVEPSTVPGDSNTGFPTMPQPQNIIRCPPVNWAKYHIVGEPLDKMHEEQKQYPYSAEPPRTQQGTRAPPHTIAAPYSPFTDRIGESNSTQPRKASKKTP